MTFSRIFPPDIPLNDINEKNAALCKMTAALFLRLWQLSLYASVSLCLSVYLSVSLSALSVWLSLSTYLPLSLSVLLSSSFCLRDVSRSVFSGRVFQDGVDVSKYPFMPDITNYTHMYACTHAFIHTYTLAYVYTRTHTCLITCIITYIYTHIGPT